MADDGLSVSSHFETAEYAGEVQPRVFISYSRKDRDEEHIVEQIISGLKDANIIVFTDLEHFERDEAWKRQARTLIQQSDSVIFITTEKWALSGNCQYEYSEAKAQAKRMFRVDSSPIPEEIRQRIPGTLQKLTGYDWRRNPFDARDRLIRDLKKQDLEWHRKHSIYQILTEIWSTHGYQEGMLLGGGTTLEEAEAWLSRKPVDVEIKKEIEDFVATSRELHDQYKADLQTEIEKRTEAVGSLGSIRERLKKSEHKIVQLKNDIRRLKKENRRLKEASPAQASLEATGSINHSSQMTTPARAKTGTGWILAALLTLCGAAAAATFLWPEEIRSIYDRVSGILASPDPGSEEAELSVSDPADAQTPAIESAPLAGTVAATPSSPAFQEAEPLLIDPQLQTGPSGANVRPAPGTDNIPITQLAAGEALFITGRVPASVATGGADWFKIVLPNGQAGYIRADVTTPRREYPSVEDYVPEKPLQAGIHGAKVRPNPDRNSTHLVHLPAGTLIAINGRLTVESATGTHVWYRTELAGGNQGFVRSDTLVPAAGLEPARP